MSSALRELLASFSVEVDTEELKRGEKELDGFGGKLREFGKLLVEAFAIHEVKEFIESQIEAGAQLKVTADRLGTNTSELQAMQLAAGEAGVHVESLTTGLRFLNRNIDEAGTGTGDAAGIFAKLGISLKDAGGVTRTSSDVMGELADKIAEIPDAAEKTNIAMKLLGRGGAELIPLLNKGGEAFAEARKDMQELGGGMGEEFVEAAHKAEEANARLKFAMTSLSANVTMAVLPTVMKLVHGFTDFVKTAVDVEKKSHIVEDALGFLKTGVIVGGIYKIVTGLQAMTRAEVIASLTNPFTLVIIGIGLAILAYNDLKVALEGGKSVFGNYFGDTGIATLREDIADLNSAIDILETAFMTVLDTLEGIGDVAVYSFDKVMDGVHRASAAVGSFLGEDGKTEQAAKEDRSEADDYAKKAQDARSAMNGHRRDTSQRWDRTTQAVLDREDAVKGVGVTGTTGIGGGVDEAHPFNALTGESFGYRYRPVMPGSAPSPAANVTSNTSQTFNNKVEIHTPSNDPKKHGELAAGAMATATKEQMNQANAKTALVKP